MPMLAASGGSGDWVGILFFFAIVLFNLIGSWIKASKQNSAAQKNKRPAAARTQKQAPAPEAVDPTDPFGPLWEALGNQTKREMAPALPPPPPIVQEKTPSSIQSDVLRERLLKKIKLQQSKTPVAAAPRPGEFHGEGPSKPMVANVQDSVIPVHSIVSKTQLRNRDLIHRLKDPEEARKFFLGKEIFQRTGEWSYDPPA